MSKRILFSIIGFSVLLAACSEKPSPNVAAAEVVRPAKLYVAQSAKESAKRVYPGTIEASRQSNLAFRVGGQLKTLPAKPGMQFKQGDVLATLDDADYRNALKDRQAKFKLAKSQYDKIIELSKQDYTSSSNVDEAEANLRASEAALSTAEDNLKHTRLLAPFNGVIAHVDIENHQVVSPNQTVLQLRGDENLDVRFGVPEALLGKLRRVESPVGLCGQVRFNAYPNNTYKACFKEYESAPDRVTRSYSVTFTMPQILDFPVLPGMAVNIEIDLSAILKDKFSEGVTVPLESVFELDGKTLVWRVDSDMRVHKTEVTVESVGNGYLLIREGLQANDTVVAAGVSYLQENQQIKPLVKERGL